MKFLSLIFASLLLLFFAYQKNISQKMPFVQSNIEQILSSMSEPDRQELCSFFKLLSSDCNFSYTLFGNKPISLVDYSTQITSSNLYHPSEFLILENGWARWESHAIFFPSQEFVLKRCKDGENIGIYLIHKKHTLQTITDNLDIFQKILSAIVEPKLLLQELCDPKQNIMKTLNDNSILLGILLGYGRTNSLDFERKVSLCHELNANMSPPFSGHLDMEALEPSARHLVKCYDKKTFFLLPKGVHTVPEGSSLAKELNNHIAREGTFELYGSHYFLDEITAPIFAIRKETLETAKLNENYLSTKQKLHQAYLKGSFLQVTLNQWMYPK